MPLKKISHSNLAMWERCPRSWWARYVEGEASVSGEAAQIGSGFGEEVVKKIGCRVNPDSPSAKRPDVKLDDEAQEHVNSLVDVYFNHPKAWTEADEAEAGVLLSPERMMFCADHYDVAYPVYPLLPFIGYIDLIKRDPVPRIVDLKTAGKADFQCGWALQLGAYSLAVEAAEAAIHAVIKTKTPKVCIWTLRLDDHLFRWTLQRIFNTWNQIGAALDVNEPPVCNPGYWCSWCPISHKCEIASFKGLLPDPADVV